MNLENKHNKQQPFGVPSGYFESFQDTLDARLAEERLREKVQNHGFAAPVGYFDSININTNNTRVISLFSKRTFTAAAAIAACLVLVLTVFKNDPNPQEFALEDISTNTLESYLQSDAIDFTNDELAAYLNEEAFSLSEATIQEEIENQALEDYILENLDATDLYIQYEE